MVPFWGRFGRPKRPSIVVGVVIPLAPKVYYTSFFSAKRDTIKSFLSKKGYNKVKCFFALRAKRDATKAS